MISPTKFWESFFTLVSLSLGAQILFPNILTIPIPLILGCGYYFVYVILYREWLLPPRAFTIWCLSLLALMTVSLFWSQNSDAATNTIIRTGSLILPLLLFVALAQNCPRDLIRKNSLNIPMVSCLSMAIILIEIYFNFPIFHYVHDKINFEPYVYTGILNNNICLFIGLLPLNIYILYTHRAYIALLALAAITILAALITESQAGQLALLFMLITAPAFLYRRSFECIKWACCAGFILLLCIFPWLAAYISNFIRHADGINFAAIIPLSGLMRLEFWGVIAEKALSLPLHGWGIDVSPLIKLTRVYQDSFMVQHPHNMFLQIWVEFGLIGVALMTATLIYIFAKIKSPLQIITICAWIIMMLFSWSVWEGWLITALFMNYALLIMTQKNRPQENPIKKGEE